MFWAYNTNSPQIDIILCKEDLTLQELLDQENVLQELKAQNLKLIEFLLKPEILHELVSLITTEPSSELEETEQYKYPNLACELLTSDLPAINERLASEEVLNKLYCFLENDPPLNPLLSSYFSRTLSILISRKSEQNWYSYQYTCLQALEFLKAKEEFIELLFKHMGTSSIMDLMHNLVTLIEGPELKQTLRGWLQNQNVIPNLVSLLSPNVDADSQVNAASALCSIIQKLRENVADLNEKPESDPILNLLESMKTIELVLSTTFNGETICETSIESAIEVLMTLMQPHLPGESRCRQMLHYSVHDKPESGLSSQNVFTETLPVRNCCHTLSLSDIIMAVLPYIKKMKEILQNPIKIEPITLTSGVVSPPFGRARLVVVKFIAVLISLNNAAINKEIILCDIPELLLDLFYAYSSNNFLHTEVEKLIAYAIDSLNGYTVTDNNNDDDIIFIHLLKKCNLLQRLVDMWMENADRENEGKFRRGYMGHVIRIASFLHIEDAKMSTFHDLLIKEVTESCLNEWNTIANEHLKFIIELHSSCLGGVRPRSCQSSDNSFEESSYKEPKSAFRDYDPEEDQNAIFMNDSSTIPYGLNSEVWGSDDEYGEEDRENTSDPWSKLGNVSDPWADSSLSSSEDSNWNIDANWANFDENFTGGAPSSSPSSQSPASASNQSCGPFGNLRPDPTLLDKFSRITFLEDNLRPESHFGIAHGNKASGGKWGVVKGENGATVASMDESSNSSFGLASQFNCFEGGQEKDSSEEMLDLESICGNTLAEKIANAQNDIRSKDQIRMRGLQQSGLQGEFPGANSCSSDDGRDSGHSGSCIRVEAAAEESVEQKGAHGLAADARSQGNGASDEGYGGVSSPLADCLTENSVDFVTAENNSTSDAESSVEFGDADNSLEFDDELANERCSTPDSLCDRTDSSAGEAVVTDASRLEAVVTDASGLEAVVAAASADAGGEVTAEAIVAVDCECGPKVETAASGCKESGEVLCENVPTIDANKLGLKCNSGAAELGTDATTDAAAALQKIHSLANGDVANGDNLTDCDTESENVNNSCSSNTEQSKNTTSDAIITDPA